MAEMNSVFIVLAAIATVCAVLVLPTITPLRRQPGESGWDYYLRIYWIPGSAVVIAVAGWLRGLVLDLRTSA